MIKAAGARLWYLPPYSPDLNPIEQAFAKIKHGCAKLRNEPSRTLGAISDTSSKPLRRPNAGTTSKTARRLIEVNTVCWSKLKIAANRCPPLTSVGTSP